MTWLDISEARVGERVMLMARDKFGEYQFGECFLHHNGKWYLIDSPIEITVKPIKFRYPCE